MTDDKIVVHAHIIPDSNFAVLDAQYIAAYDDKRLDEVIDTVETDIDNLEIRTSEAESGVSTNAAGISSLDERVTALEESGGGGSGGTTNYNELTNIPKINNVSLKGNLSASDLEIDTKSRLIQVTFKNISITAGTAGSRALQKSFRISDYMQDGEYCIGLTTVLNGGNTSHAIITPMIYNQILYVNFYRASGSAATYNEVNVMAYIGRYSDSDITSYEV